MPGEQHEQLRPKGEIRCNKLVYSCDVVRVCLIFVNMDIFMINQDYTYLIYHFCTCWSYLILIKYCQ